MASTVEDLGNSQYVVVTSYRKDGRAVPTPVWVVRDNDSLAIWTVADSGKVKRIRRNGSILVAACDMRGRPTGDPVSAHAELLDPTSSARVRGLLTKKYGIVGRLSMFGSRLRRGRDGTIAIRITLTP